MKDLSIDKTGAKYFKYGLWITASLFIIGMIADSLIGILAQWDLIISTVFSLLSLAIYVACWKSVAKVSKGNLSHFYLAASVLRMLSALLVFVIYCFINRQYDNILQFAICFLSFYLILLIYNVGFFAKVEKSYKEEK